MQLISSALPSTHRNTATTTPAALQHTAGTRTLYFGKNAPKPVIGPGLFVSMVRRYGDITDKAFAGGLTTVSMTIPYGVRMPFKLDNKEYGGIRMDIVAPMYKAVKAANKTIENPFKPTGIETTVTYGDGPAVPFKLLKRTEPIAGSNETITAFAIESPVFDAINKPYMENDEDAFHVLSTITGKPAGQIEAMIKKDNTGTDYKGNHTAAVLSGIYNKAVANLIKDYNDKHPPAKGEGYKFSVANDWVAGTLPAFLDKAGMADMAQIYFLHNTHDQGLSVDDAAKLGLDKAYLEKYDAIHKVRDKKSGKTNNATSFSDLGMAHANGIIMSEDYAKRVADKSSGLATKQLYLKRLEAHIAANRLHDIHHVPEGEFDPFNSPALAKDGFVQLQGKGPDTVTLEDLKTYKAHNKAVIQKKLGLNQNPDAIVMGFLGSRQDPGQKSIESILSAAPKLLKKHANLQLIILGPPVGNKKRLTKIHEQLAKEFPGQVYSKPEGIDGDDRFQLTAASDVLLMPSSYEPFGLAHIEGMLMGCVALTTNVDGQVKSNLDPLTDENSDDPLRKKFLKQYGQTGFKVKAFHPGKYHKAVGKLQPRKDKKPQKPLTETDKAILAEVEGKFIEATTRAITQFENDRDGFYQIGLNGLRFVNSAHSWPLMAPRYGKAILAAMAHKDIADKTYLPKTTNPVGSQLAVNSDDATPEKTTEKSPQAAAKSDKKLVATA